MKNTDANIDVNAGKDSKTDADAELMTEMRARFVAAQDNDAQNRDASIRDVRFVSIAGEQWDQKARAKRKNRPCYEFNRLRQHIKQVTGNQRQSKPSIKLRAVEQSDKDTAEVMQGLIRNIENVSNADRAYDTGFEWAVTGGYGVWRVSTKYNSDDTFDQDICIDEITNPYSVYFDPSARQFDKRDALFAFVVTTMGKDEFKHLYPDQDLASFDYANYDVSRWQDEYTITLCEYWYKVFEKKKVVMLSTGDVIYKDDMAKYVGQDGKPITIVKERETEVPVVKMALVSGIGVIEKSDWAGKYIPLVPVFGDIIDIDGEVTYSGMVRFSKDAQRVYNFHRTTMIETMAQSPKVPYLVTPAQIKGFENLWKGANTDLTPFLPFNADANNPGAPQRSGGVDFPAAMMQASIADVEDLKAVTGQFDASLGMRGNETSGVAIVARKAEGNTATYCYIDNLSRSIKYTGEILVDLIPKIYDTERVVRILGKDGGEKWVTINGMVLGQDGVPQRVNDLSTGKYDVAVTVGTSYATQRMEAVDTLMQLMDNPTIAPYVADLLAQNLDMPNSDELAQRLRNLGIQQGFIKPTPEDLEGQGPVEKVKADMTAEFQAQSQQFKMEADKAIMNAETKALNAEQQTLLLRAQLAKAETKDEVAKAQLLLDRQTMFLEQYRAETERLKVSSENDYKAQQLLIERMKVLQSGEKLDKTLEQKYASDELDATVRLKIAGEQNDVDQANTLVKAIDVKEYHTHNMRRHDSSEMDKLSAEIQARMDSDGDMGEKGEVENDLMSMKDMPKGEDDAD